jgi:hypothetical protein
VPGKEVESNEAAARATPTHPAIINGYHFLKLDREKNKAIKIVPSQIVVEIMVFEDKKI